MYIRFSHTHTVFDAAIIADYNILPAESFPSLISPQNPFSLSPGMSLDYDLLQTRSLEVHAGNVLIH